MNVERKKRGWIYRTALVFVTLSAVALNALLLVSIVWKCSVYYRDTDDSSGVLIDLYDGCIGISYINIDPAMQMEGMDIHRRSEPLPLGDIFCGVDYFYLADYFPYLQLPLWLPIVLLYIWPLIEVIRWNPYRRARGHCPACDYDMRGSPSGVCPECGADSSPSDTDR